MSISPLKLLSSPTQRYYRLSRAGVSALTAHRETGHVPLTVLVEISDDDKARYRGKIPPITVDE